MEVESQQILVSGLVQGVGYRAFARRQGEQLGLKGWARNLSDGRVEILVSGHKDLIERFKSVLAAGPIGSRVDAIEVKQVKVTLAEKEFTIKASGDKPWSD